MWQPTLREHTFLILITSLFVLAILYRKTILEIRKKRWRLNRKRSRSCSPPGDVVGDFFVRARVNSLLRYFELDRRVSKRFDWVQFESLGEYMNSLSLESGALSIESALISILDKFGLTLALPLALLVPSTWKKSYDSKDVEAKFLPFPRRLIGAALSTKSLGAICEIVKEIGYDSLVRTGDASDCEKKRHGAVELLLMGSNPKSDHGLSNIVDLAFHMDEKSLHDVTQEILCDDKEGESPKQIHPAFIGLYFGNQGLDPLYSPEEEAVNAVVSCLCNRLVGNALRGTQSMLDPNLNVSSELFHVTFEDEENIVTLDRFFEALEMMGHSVSLTMRTNITSMGLGLSVAPGGGEGVKHAQIPICYPLKTGLAMRKKSDSLEHTEAMTLMTHGACFVRITGPLLKNVELEWCLNITGMTGFQPVGGVARPWQQDSLAFVSHDEEILAKEKRQVFRLMTVISAVTNAVADVDHVVLGGYGFMGVCLDSVALLQQAITGRCTLYPLFLGGVAKTSLLDGYSKFEKEKSEYSRESQILRSSLQYLPCDILVEPRNAVDTAERALASLPQQSIFLSVESCKKDLKLARDFALQFQND